MTVVQSNSPVVVPARLEFRDLGRMDYRSALELQREIQRDVIESRGSDGKMVVLMVEHDPPVITVSRRPGARTNLVASDAQLHAAGVEVCETDRGGDITYHGPGQLVVYPILDLNALNLRMISYLRFLEQIVIDTLARFNIHGSRDAGATGVWVSSPQASSLKSQASKICAIGVRVSRWVSMHGLALNVETNLDHFNLIVPCGLAGRSVTSMRQMLGDACPDMAAVKRELAATLTTAVAKAQAMAGTNSRSDAALLAGDQQVGDR